MKEITEAAGGFVYLVSALFILDQKGTKVPSFILIKPHAEDLQT